MANVLALEEFSTAGPEPLAPESPSTGGMGSGPENPDTEAARAAGYEQGYAAGWDDATRAAQEEQERIGTEFAHNLLDLNFTFHEARSHVICSVMPVLEAAMCKLLPEAVSAHLADIVSEHLEPLLEQAADRPILIAVAPQNRTLLEPLLKSAGPHPFELSEEPSLGPGQVRLQSGDTERFIDLDEAMNTIRRALQTIDIENREAFSNG